MRLFNNLLAVFMVVLACRGQETEKVTFDGVDYQIIGANLEASNVLTDAEMTMRFDKMTVKDTLRTKFKATVTDVCKVKGCWMKLKLDDGQEAMVRFKDYGFFMPSDITGKEVIVNGYAYVEAMSVEDQKHYAKDGGEAESEIAKITEPKKTFGFEADGVLIKNQ
ncbi:DUF4920 domain-containing protein [Zobellia laminariae]|uniref:DUF4920 domain-containing protein n=1 Tax=Zobellia laminariae TaxID=248906 RepID=UPI0026F45622|nr:DUF4920 domain-containing protein [Zobellia laminariae]WKX74907.1 DUF4920 domain-containing protein [Zobellia laminariae]